MSADLIFKDDENNHELRCFRNTENRLFMEISVPGEDYYSGWLTLSMEDAKELIRYLIDEVE